MEGDKKAHPVGEVHFHPEDTDILGTSVRGVDAVSEDTVNRGHFWREREG